MLLNVDVSKVEVTKSGVTMCNHFQTTHQYLQRELSKDEGAALVYSREMDNYILCLHVVTQDSMSRFQRR
jgi:hypothetical protein